MPPSTSAQRQQLDHLHQQLFELIDAALALPPGEYGAAYHHLVAQLEQDFRQEEQWMDTCQCADAHLHREQHARMQAGLHHAAAELERGEPGPARQALAALREWLPFHIASQDQHLLHAMQQVLPSVLS